MEPASGGGGVGHPTEGPGAAGSAGLAPEKGAWAPGHTVTFSGPGCRATLG